MTSFLSLSKFFIMLAPIRLLLFEDNISVRDLIKDYCAQRPNTLFLTDTFPTADKAIRQVIDSQPDVVLMDIEMPGISGLDAIKKIKAVRPETKILVQTRFEENHPIFVALCRGASGYILKTDLMDQLEQAIINVNKGGGYLSQAIITKVIQLFNTPLFMSNPDYIPLTPREMEVLQEMGKGKTYDEIGVALKLTFHGVHAHIRHIYEKLHVNSKAEAIIKAIELKLIP